MMSATKIAPKWIAKWTDICCTKSHLWIVRSDLKAVMKTTGMHDRKDMIVCDMHPSCQMGDHYLATADDWFYIIKGDAYRKVADLTTDANAQEQPLHPNCRGGSHYFGCKEGCFCIVFADKGKMRMVTDLATDENAKEVTMQQKCKDGMYYWADNKYFYIMKWTDKWGCAVWRTTSVSEDVGMDMLSVNPWIMPFLPGGLAALMGPCFGNWVLLKSFKNLSKDMFKCDKMAKVTVGCKKTEMMEMLQELWCIKMVAMKYKLGLLVERMFKTQLCLPMEFGGMMEAPAKKDWWLMKKRWCDAMEEDGSMMVEITPGSSVFVWQYQIGLGDQTIVFTGDMMTTTTCDPPTECPFPAA